MELTLNIEDWLQLAVMLISGAVAIVGALVGGTYWFTNRLYAARLSAKDATIGLKDVQLAENKNAISASERHAQEMLAGKQAMIDRMEAEIASNRELWQQRLAIKDDTIENLREQLKSSAENFQRLSLQQKLEAVNKWEPPMKDIAAGLAGGITITVPKNPQLEKDIILLDNIQFLTATGIAEEQFEKPDMVTVVATEAGKTLWENIDWRFDPAKPPILNFDALNTPTESED